MHARSILGLGVAVLLAACGGGGSDADDPLAQPPPVLQQPPPDGPDAGVPPDAGTGGGGGGAPDAGSGGGGGGAPDAGSGGGGGGGGGGGAPDAGSGGGGGGGAPDAGGGGTPDAGPSGPLTCADVDLGSALPVRHTGTLRSASGATPPSCTRGDREGLAVRTFAWRAPRTGTYVFDTATSAFDTVLSARRGACSGPELTCNDDFISYGGTSGLRVSLAAGESVVLTLAGSNGAEQGFYVLHGSELAASEAGAACFDWADGDHDGRVDCADPDCRGQPGCGGSGCADADLGLRESASVSGTTSGGGNRFEGTCSVFRAQQDRAYTWTAPRTGTWVVDSTGSQTGVALYVLTGCRGEELACGRIVYTAGDPNKTTSVTFDARAGQTLLLVVDGQRGPDSGPREEIPVDFRLNVHPLGVETGAACSNGVDDDADGYPDAHDTECGGTGEPW